MWLKNNLANLFTLANLACGFFAIILVLSAPSTAPFWLMVLAAIFDFFDGFVARATKTTSTLGADLDSLADMITFGLLPGIMLYAILPIGWNYLAILVPIFSAWRLAKFNNDTRPAHFFYGLPTPANALVIAGIFAANAQSTPTLDGISAMVLAGNITYWLLPLTFVLCILMVSDMRLLSNKITAFSIAKYRWHISILILGIMQVTFIGYLGLSLAIISYVLISIFVTFVPVKN